MSLIGAESTLDRKLNEYFAREIVLMGEVDDQRRNRVANGRLNYEWLTGKW